MILHVLNLTGDIPKLGYYIRKHQITRIWQCQNWDVAIVQLDGKDIGIVHNCRGGHEIPGDFRVCYMDFAPDTDIEYDNVKVYRINRRKAHLVGYLPIQFSKVQRMTRWRKLYMGKDYDGKFYLIIIR